MDTRKLEQGKHSMINYTNEDIVRAFNLWISNHNIAIERDIFNDTWYVTINDKKVSINHKTSVQALLWMLEYKHWSGY